MIVISFMSVAVTMVIFIYDSHHATVISPQVPSAHKSFLLFQNFLHCVDLVFFLDDSSERICNVLMLICENFIFPKGSSDCVPGAVRICSINELGSLVECNVVSPDVDVSILAHHVALLPVDLETCLTCALSEEKYFIHFIKLVQKNLVE